MLQYTNKQAFLQFVPADGKATLIYGSSLKQTCWTSILLRPQPEVRFLNWDTPHQAPVMRLQNIFKKKHKNLSFWKFVMNLGCLTKSIWKWSKVSKFWVQNWIFKYRKVLSEEKKYLKLVLEGGQCKWEMTAKDSVPLVKNKWQRKPHKDRPVRNAFREWQTSEPKWGQGQRQDNRKQSRYCLNLKAKAEFCIWQRVHGKAWAC